MKSIRITFRLKPYQLARGLQTIRQLEPNYKLISLNDIVKVIYHDYLAKMTLNKLDAIPDNIIAEIMQIISKPARAQMTLEELIAIKKPDPELLSEINKLTNKSTKKSKASSFDDPNKTDSDISALTDFSPPKDWKK